MSRFSPPLHSSQPTESTEQSPIQEKSKSQRKRDMLDLQQLAVRLCELPAARLANLPLTEALADAVNEMQRVRSHEGKRRHLQYLGKLMRTLDEVAIAAISLEIDKMSGQHQACTDELHQLERWRADLLKEDQAITLLLQAYPRADGQRLRTLVRNARAEVAKNSPARNFRELFRMLKQLRNAPPDQT
jgi:ribosome-associated protein